MILPCQPCHVHEVPWSPYLTSPSCSTSSFGSCSSARGERRIWLETVTVKKYTCWTNPTSTNDTCLNRGWDHLSSVHWSAPLSIWFLELGKPKRRSRGYPHLSKYCEGDLKWSCLFFLSQLTSAGLKITPIFQSHDECVSMWYRQAHSPWWMAAWCGAGMWGENSAQPPPGKLWGLHWQRSSNAWREEDGRMTFRVLWMDLFWAEIGCLGSS